MFKKLIIAAAFVVTPLVFMEDSSAGDCYPAYRVPVVRHHHPVPVYYGSYARPPIHAYRHVPYRSPYLYGAGYGGYRGYRGIGGYPYYGNAIGVGRSGFSLRIGF